MLSIQLEPEVTFQVVFKTLRKEFYDKTARIPHEIPVLPQRQDCLPAMLRIIEAHKISKVQITVTRDINAKCTNIRFQNIAYQA